MTRAPRIAFLTLLAACSTVPDKGIDAPATHGADGVPAPAATSDDALRARVHLLFERALADNRAHATLASLLAAAPNRLTGSKGYDDAVAWSLDHMRAIGLVNVRAETFPVPCWVRGTETAAMLSGATETPLRVTALGGSIGTAAGGLTAEVVEVRTFEQLRQMGDAARGKIVFFNRPMPRALMRTGQAYGEAVPQRSNGAIEAGKVGAVGAIVRSMTTTIDGNPHTGAMQYDPAVPSVPAAAIATADAELLSRAIAAGPVQLRLELGCRTLPDVPGANAIGEIRGSELPDEFVVVGGHLDAWDLGTGAHDDGAGCVHALEAARLVVESGITPRRTIRIVLFANEENGLRGATNYDAMHAHERHVAALESDAGGFMPEGFTCSLSGDAALAHARLFAPLKDLGMGAFATGGGGGADIAPLGRRGTVLFGLLVAGHRYFDHHHSTLDRLEAVNERELALGAAAVAYAVSVLADAP